MPEMPGRGEARGTTGPPQGEGVCVFGVSFRSCDLCTDQFTFPKCTSLLSGVRTVVCPHGRF